MHKRGQRRWRSDADLPFKEIIMKSAEGKMKEQIKSPTQLPEQRNKNDAVQVKLDEDTWNG